MLFLNFPGIFLKVRRGQFGLGILARFEPPRCLERGDGDHIRLKQGYHSQLDGLLVLKSDRQAMVNRSENTCRNCYLRTNAGNTFPRMN